MSANDAIVLKANFEAWKQRAVDLKGVDHWLYYCVEQFVKPYALDDEELRSCITDGGNDGGADAIFFLVNQRSLVEEDTTLEQKNVSKIRVMIVQCKHSGGFKPTEIEKWWEFTEDFFDLSKPANSFWARYNESVLRIMGTWKSQYLKVSGAFPEITIEYLYITGDDAIPDAYSEDSGNRVIAKASKLVGKANCSVRYIGAEQLWEQAQRRPPKSKTLIWAESPMTTVEGFVARKVVGGAVLLMLPADLLTFKRVYSRLLSLACSRFALSVRAWAACARAAAGAIALGSRCLQRAMEGWPSG
jgi:hypothetical protein